MLLPFYADVKIKTIYGYFMMKSNKIGLLIQYIILTAGQEDEYFDRQLGPIHFIKYIYLADLAYAEQNRGETFTGIDWKFYKFGPWSQAVNARIEPALTALGADKKTFPSNFGDKDDWVRWQITDDSLLDDIERELPFSITSRLKRDIHKFGQDTPSLLSYIYRTSPMLLAAPNDLLDFSHLKTSENSRIRLQGNTEPLSKKKGKQLKEKMRDLRSLSSKKLADKRKVALVKPPTTPRYDDVYFEGLEWLDTLAGAKITEGEKEAVFSDLIWKSPARRGESVPD